MSPPSSTPPAPQAAPATHVGTITLPPEESARIGTPPAVAAATPAEPFSLRALLRPGMRAITRLWPAILLVELCAVGLLVAYRVSPAFQAAMARFVDFKDGIGILGGALLTAIAAGLLPEGFKAVALKEWRWDRARTYSVLFNFAYFFYIGVIVHYLYAAQNALFGADDRLITGLKKMAADQLIYTPFFAVPVAVLLFRWKRYRLSARRVVAEVDRYWYLRRCVPILPVNWAFWMPTVLVIYLLPPGVQFAMFLLCTTAWAMLVTTLATGDDEG